MILICVKRLGSLLLNCRWMLAVLLVLWCWANGVIDRECRIMGSCEPAMYGVYGANQRDEVEGELFDANGVV